MAAKAQVSIETITIFIFMLVIFSFLVMSSYYRQNESDLSTRVINVNNECQRLSDMISYVFSLGNGADLNVTTIYKISIFQNGMILVNDSHGSTGYCTTTINSSRVSGVTGLLRVRNINGNVSLGVAG